jgi:hypothetical protein
VNAAQSLSLTVADQRHPAHEVHCPDVARRSPAELARDTLMPARRFAAAKPVENKPRELRRAGAVATASDGYEVVFSY